MNIETILKDFKLGIDYLALTPEIIVCAFALLTLLIEPFLKDGKKQFVMHLSWIALVAALISLFSVWKNLNGWKCPAILGNICY